MTKENSMLVKSTFKFPNGMVITCGYDDQQIPELQGVYTLELDKKIRAHSDSKTEFIGFEIEK